MKKNITLALLLLGTGNFMRAMEDLFSSALPPKIESNGSTFERLPMDEMDRWHAQDAAKRYQEYLTNNDKQDTIAERKNFIQVNNQNPDCYEIQDIAQIAQGFTLLRQEEITQQISCNKYNPTASSGTVASFLLQQEQSTQAKKKSQSPEKIIDNKEEESLLSPRISSSVTSSSHTQTEFSWLSRKKYDYDNVSPLMKMLLKDDEALPSSEALLSKELLELVPSDQTGNNPQQTLSLPKGARPIPLRPMNRKN